MPLRRAVGRDQSGLRCKLVGKDTVIEVPRAQRRPQRPTAAERPGVADRAIDGIEPHRGPRETPRHASRERAVLPRDAVEIHAADDLRAGAGTVGLTEPDTAVGVLGHRDVFVAGRGCVILAGPVKFAATGVRLETTLEAGVAVRDCRHDEIVVVGEAPVAELQRRRDARRVGAGVVGVVARAVVEDMRRPAFVEGPAQAHVAGAQAPVGVGAVAVGGAGARKRINIESLAAESALGRGRPGAERPGGQRERPTLPRLFAEFRGEVHDGEGHVAEEHGLGALVDVDAPGEVDIEHVEDRMGPDGVEARHAVDRELDLGPGPRRAHPADEDRAALGAAEAADRVEMRDDHAGHATQGGLQVAGIELDELRRGHGGDLAREDIEPGLADDRRGSDHVVVEADDVRDRGRQGNGQQQKRGKQQFHAQARVVWTRAMGMAWRQFASLNLQTAPNAGRRLPPQEPAPVAGLMYHCADG